MGDAVTPTEGAAAPAAGAPVQPIATAVVGTVIQRMNAILAPLAAADGVACFGRLYLAVTEGVQQEVAGMTFADRDFLAKLDDTFAGLFFTADDAFKQKAPQAPRAWAPLFEARGRKGIAPLQFALAGMNAHINRDLPVALVTSFEQAGLKLESGSPQHEDYLKINKLLAEVETRVKEQYLTGWLARADRLIHRVHRIDDVVAMWDIARARDAAWTNAEALWAVRGSALYDQLLDTIDHTVGFAGRGLLVPADSRLKRMGRALKLL
jgi:uncharacterized protein DUF5995